MPPEQPELHETVSALNEAVRGKTGLQQVVSELSAEVRELQKFRSTIIGVQLASSVLIPVIWHYLQNTH